jgi:hypothetical protein
VIEMRNQCNGEPDRIGAFPDGSGPLNPKCDRGLSFKDIGDENDIRTAMLPSGAMQGEATRLSSISFNVGVVRSSLG